MCVSAICHSTDTINLMDIDDSRNIESRWKVSLFADSLPIVRAVTALSGIRDRRFTIQRPFNFHFSLESCSSCNVSIMRPRQRRYLANRSDRFSLIPDRRYWYHLVDTSGKSSSSSAISVPGTRRRHGIDSISISRSLSRKGASGD